MLTLQYGVQQHESPGPHIVLVVLPYLLMVNEGRNSSRCSCLYMASFDRYCCSQPPWHVLFPLHFVSGPRVPHSMLHGARQTKLHLVIVLQECCETSQSSLGREGLTHTLHLYRP